MHAIDVMAIDAVGGGLAEGGVGFRAFRRDGAALNVDGHVTGAAMLAIDADGSPVHRRDVKVLHVDVDISGGSGRLRAFYPLAESGIIAAYGLLGLRFSRARAAERNGQRQGDGAYQRPRIVSYWSPEH